MSAGARRIWLIAIGFIAAALAVVAVAWACTPSADIRMDRTSGPPGSVVSLTGRGFSNGLVEIRMDSVDSSPIATAQGPSFSISLTIPDTSPGWHVFGAVGYDSDGNAVGQPSTTFYVTGSGNQAPPQAAPIQPTRRAPAHPRRTAPSHTTPVRRPAPVHHSAPRPTARHLPGQATTSPRSAGRATPAVVSSQAAARQAAHPAQPPHRAKPVTAQHPRAVEHPSVRQPHTGAARPQPADAWAPQPASAGSSGSSGPGTAVAIGAGLLGIGLVALFAGFAVAEVRRRRAPARARRRD